jgi:hypothetical protein
MTPRVSSHQAMKFLGVSPATRRRWRGWSRAAAILSCTLRRRSAVRIATESSWGLEPAVRLVISDQRCHAFRNR